MPILCGNKNKRNFIVIKRKKERKKEKMYKISQNNEVLVGETPTLEKVFIDYMRSTLIVDTEEGEIITALVKGLKNKDCLVFNLTFNEKGKLDELNKLFITNIMAEMKERYEAIQNSNQPDYIGTPIVITALYKPSNTPTVLSWEELENKDTIEAELFALKRMVRAIGYTTKVSLYLSIPSIHYVRDSDRFENYYNKIVVNHNTRTASVETLMDANPKEILV